MPAYFCLSTNHSSTICSSASNGIAPLWRRMSWNSLTSNLSPRFWRGDVAVDLVGDVEFFLGNTVLEELDAKAWRINECRLSLREPTLVRGANHDNNFCTDPQAANLPRRSTRSLMAGGSPRSHSDHLSKNHSHPAPLRAKSGRGVSLRIGSWSREE